MKGLSGSTAHFHIPMSTWEGLNQGYRQHLLPQIWSLGDCLTISRLHVSVRTEQVGELVCAVKCAKVEYDCISCHCAHSNFIAIVLQEILFSGLPEKVWGQLVSVIQHEVITNARLRDTLFVSVLVIDSWQFVNM